MEVLLYGLIGAAVVAAIVWARRRFWSFPAQKPEDYRDSPGLQFDLRRHLNGEITCEGVIYGPTGRVASRFVGEFHAEWDGNRGVMKERFEYDSGSVQHREWHLQLGNDGQIRATAPDVEGEGTGMQMGPTVQLKYRLRLPADAGGHVLDTVDWMYLAPNGSIVNRSQFRKFGIKVAELVATMRRKETA